MKMMGATEGMRSNIYCIVNSYLGERLNDCPNEERDYVDAVKSCQTYFPINS